MSLVVLLVPAVAASSADPELAYFIARCSRMSYVQKEQFINGLAQRTDAKSLLSRLARVEKTGVVASMAAFYAVKLSSAIEAKELCRCLEGTPQWPSALSALYYHRQSEVGDYVLATMASGDPRVRYHCYHLCSVAEWHILVGYAVHDQFDTRFIMLINGGPDESLGRMARRYLNSVSSHKAEKRPTKITVD